MPAISLLQFAQSRNIDLKLFLEGAGRSRLFRSAEHKSSSSYLNVHSDLPIKLKKAQAVSLHILVLFLLMEAMPVRTICLVWCLLKKASILRKIMCHSVSKGESCSHKSSPLHFHAPDMNPEHQWISDQWFFSFVTWSSWVGTEKKLDNRTHNPPSKIMLQTIRKEKHRFLGQILVSHLLVPPNCWTAHSALKQNPKAPMVLGHFKWS